MSSAADCVWYRMPQTMSATPDTAKVFVDLKESLRAAVETYSNVHRGSGHFSIVTTRLFEHARKVVLECAELSDKDNEVIFCTPRRAENFKTQLGADVLRCLSSQDLGLPLAVRALVLKRSALRRVIPFETGGGTARLVSRDWVVWAKAPGRFEAGTPAIINVIALGRALQLLRQHGIRSFEHPLESQACAKDILYQGELEPFSGRKLLEELTRTCMGRGVQVPTSDGTRAYINLDNAASTPTFSPIWDTFCHTLQQSAQTRADIVQEVKSICSRALGAPSTDYDVIFTSNTTEAINLVARSLGTESGRDIEPVVLNSLLEHNSNELPWRMIPGRSLVRLTVDEDGFISLQELESVLRSYNKEGNHGSQRIRLVAVSGASNVLGTFNDLAEIGRITHQYGAQLLVDGAQLVAHRKVAMASSGIDYLAFSGHKMYAPFGSGALVTRRGQLALAPGERELLEASGNENAAGIAALGKAFVLLQRIGMNVIQDEEQSLAAHALEQLSKVPGIRLFGVKSSTSAHYAQKGGVIAFLLSKPMPKQLAQRLAENGGIGVRYGCHCSHLLVKRLHKIPPFLERVQWLIVNLFPQMELPGVVRASLGIENNREHVDALVVALNDIATYSKNATHGGSFKARMDDFVQAAIRRVYS
jgi:selenocysteine lyase/cysteine desulfurase